MRLYVIGWLSFLMILGFGCKETPSNTGEKLSTISSPKIDEALFKAPSLSFKEDHHPDNKIDAPPAAGPLGLPPSILDEDDDTLGPFIPAETYFVMSGGGSANPRCGNNVREHIEECDTAGASATCDPDCTDAVCGDGYVNLLAGEQCDDGNSINDDECSNYCLLPRCGDGIVQVFLYEQCDDYDTIDNGDGCSEECQLNNVCGDNITQIGEDCDDGNLVDNGNGCDADCQANNVCGDGIVQTEMEACDSEGFGSCTPDCSFPLFECDIGEEIIFNQPDDDSSEIEFPTVFFPLQGFGSRNSAFVNTNGNVTLDEGDPDFSESVPLFLEGAARLGILWDDLNLENAGSVHFNVIRNRVIVTWIDVPEFTTGAGNNTFQLQFNHQGKIIFIYNDIGLDDALVGVTPGNGAADPGETDFDPTVPLAPDFFSTGLFPTVYQQFIESFDSPDLPEDPFDLDGQALEFVPHDTDSGWNIQRFIAIESCGLH